MSDRFEPRAIDALVLSLLVAGASIPALCIPTVVDHNVNYLSFVLWGMPIVLATSIGVWSHAQRPRISSAIFLLMIPGLLTARLITLRVDYSTDNFVAYLALAIGFTFYFLGVGRLLAGPRGRVPHGRHDRAAFWMLVGLWIYALTGPIYAAHHIPLETEYSAKINRLFFIRSYALLFAIAIALALIPRVTLRDESDNRSGRSGIKAALYVSIALVGLALSLRL